MLRTFSLVSRSLATRTKAAPATSILLKRRYGTEKSKEMADYGANHLSPGIGKISSVVMKKGQGEQNQDEIIKWKIIIFGFAKSSTQDMQRKSLLKSTMYFFD